MGDRQMVRRGYVSNLITLTLFMALATAILLLLGSVALELVELPPALSGPQ
jgi:hypothetical protein